MLKKKVRLIAIGLIAIFAVAYIVAPGIAGAIGIGQREGPCFYPEEFHTVMYSIFYENVYGEKPRECFDKWMYRRPLFYGLPQRLKSAADREAYIQRVRQNNNLIVGDMIKMNSDIERGQLSK